MKGRHHFRRRFVKGSVMRDMAPHLPAHAHFVPGAIRLPALSTPGPDSGFAELFVNRWCILTPPPNADQGRRRAAALPSGG
jgi:cyclohexadieny/prephenate dehydrogenase